MKFAKTILIFPILLAACSPSTAMDCARPDVFCVGLVTDFGGVDDHGLNQSAWEGVLAAQEQGLVNHSAFIETVDQRDRAKNIRSFAESGYDMIVTVGFSMTDETRLAADEWAGLTFVGVDQPREDSHPNLATIVFPEDQGGYLAGALAALTTQTGNIAALCETESLSEMWRTCEGFRAGARSISADINARITYHPDGGSEEFFNDPEWGAEQAVRLQRLGVDVIFAAGGETARGALESAAALGIFVIGADEDIYYQIVGNDHVLSSSVKQAGLSLQELIRLEVQGKILGMEFVGQYALAPYHALERLVPPAVRVRLAGLVSALASGAVETNVRPAP